MPKWKNGSKRGGGVHPEVAIPGHGPFIKTWWGSRQGGVIGKKGRGKEGSGPPEL